MQSNTTTRRALLSNDIFERDLEITALKLEVELLKRAYHQLDRFYLSYIEKTSKINCLQKGIQP